MGWVTMSERELNRIEVLAQVDDDKLSVAAASGMLALTRRQMFRLLKRYRTDGAASIRHKARGRAVAELYPRKTGRSPQALHILAEQAAQG